MFRFLISLKYILKSIQNFDEEEDWQDGMPQVGEAEDFDIIGWACPSCNSEFDNNDNIMYIYGENYSKGKA